MAVKTEALAPEYRTAPHQLVYITGGNGALANAHGNACFCINLYTGKHTRWERYDIQGEVRPERIPGWARQRLEEIKREQQRSARQQIQGQTGSIGYLRADFGKSGAAFYNSWFDHIPSFRSEDFSDEFDEVINSLRFESENGDLLKSRNAMRVYCKDCPESAFEGNYGTEYGFRIDHGRYSLLLRCSPMQEDYNLYAYCYVKEYLDQHMEKARRGIQFITPEYREKFRISDGDKIQILCSDGEKLLRACRYIDDYHVEVGRNLYHICEFAERMEQAGNTVVPMRSSLPDQCLSVLSTGELISITKGEAGYSLNTLRAMGMTNREVADEANRAKHISKAQEAAMLAGALFGWDAPAADPKNYDTNGIPVQAARNRHRERER